MWPTCGAIPRIMGLSLTEIPSKSLIVSTIEVFLNAELPSISLAIILAIKPKFLDRGCWRSSGGGGVAGEDISRFAVRVLCSTT